MRIAAICLTRRTSFSGGGKHVWKVAGKVFAIGGWVTDATSSEVTFKVSPLSFEILKNLPGLRPAPYLASRGLTWIQRTSSESLDDRALLEALAESHRLAAATLPKRTQAALGLAASPLGKPRPAATTRSNRTSHSTRPRTEP